MKTKVSCEVKQRVDTLYAKIKNEEKQFIGYPCSLDFDYSDIYPFLGLSVNNVGDPFMESNYHINTHELECEVLETFRELTHAPVDDFWGYITNGGTEGNMYAIYLAREIYPEGIVFYSEDTHYSVAKVLRMLHMRSVMIRSCDNGSIDLEDLRESIKIHRDVPPIIFANVGTTMKGAIDDIEGIKQILKDLVIHEYYIHADAALSGMILPFVENPPAFDFSSGINSISISGHKMIGSSIPCGICLARKHLVDRIAKNIEYIGTMDTTVTGSRNGVTPLFLWYALNTVGLDGFKEKIRRCLEISEYAIDELKKIGVNAWRNDHSITVVFPRPPMPFIKKWQLAVHNEWAHIITMPHVDKPMVDMFVSDLKKSMNKIDGE